MKTSPNTRARRIGAALALLTAMPALRCSTASPSAPAAKFLAPPASTVVDDPSSVKIRREAFVIDGSVPPANPRTGAATPAELNRVRVVRYRVDADPPIPARAIFVMMPGFLGGAGSLDGTARAMVRRSTQTEAIEAWAIDRRSNLLEDTHGLDVAEVTGDSSQATRYYFDGETVAGRSFEGFHSGASETYASEWGLATTVGDLDAIISLVPAAERARRIVLLGHSLGGSIVEEYAAWDFLGLAGSAKIAALVLVDGVSGSEGAATPPLDEQTYSKGGPQSSVGFGPQPGVDTDIRAGSVFTSLPFVGIKGYVVSEYVALLARLSPDAVAVDPTRDGLLQVMLGQSPMPRLSNRAAFGFAFDIKSCGLQIAAVSCGQGAGGAISQYDSAIGGKLEHPSDPSASYTWVDFDQTTPKGSTSIDDAARSWYEGPGLNFAEWYFPQRLSIDARAASTLNAMPGDWRVDHYGLLAQHGARIDVPILAVGSVVASTEAAYGALKAMAAPVGAGRPQAGRSRSEPDAFSTVILPSLTHIDWVVGADLPGSVVGGYFDTLYAFAMKSTPAGAVTVPVTKGK